MMKNILFILFPICLFSQGQCFDDGEKHYPSGNGFLSNEASLELIVFKNPKHVRFTENKNNLSYENDELLAYPEVAESQLSWEKKRLEYDKKFEDFLLLFNDKFHYLQRQNEKGRSYAIAKNHFGYWLLEITNKKPKAYYIGFSKYTHINLKQGENFIRHNTLYLDGSFITVDRGVRYDDTEVIKDYLTFEVNLQDIKKDSDNDGYNDFFEQLIFLNPNSKDTDGDGIPDFEDLNPLYPSERNKFTDLYDKIIEEESLYYSKESHYTFYTYESDCPYFQNINPNNRVLILTGNQAYQFKNQFLSRSFPTFYGRIKKTSDESVFEIPYFESSRGGKIIATFKNGKWSLIKEQGYVT